MAYSHGYVKRNFFTGKFDREFSGQENAITAAGMVYCNNVLTSPQGECKARPGTEFLGGLDSEAVIIPYRRAGKDLALVFTDSHLDVKTFDNSGNLVAFTQGNSSIVTWTNTDNNTPTSTPLDISNGNGLDYFANAYKYWTLNPYNLIDDYQSNRLMAQHIRYPGTIFTMRFTATKALNRLGMYIIRADGDFSMSALNDARNWVNNASLQYSDDGVTWQTMQLSEPAHFVFPHASTPYGDRIIPTLQFDTVITAKHEYWRVVIIWNGEKMPGARYFMTSFYGLVEEETPSIPQTYSTPYTINLLKKIKYSQNYAELILCDGVHNPYSFSMTGSVITFQEKNTYSFLTTDGVPSCVRFFQNRLYFGGFAAYPNRVRGSRFGDYNYNDFTVVTEDATVADPINVECNQFSERITDLWGGFNVLYAQSSEGIAFVTGMSATPDFTLRCSERASGITPTMKENIMYYVGYDRRKIYAFSYDNNIQQFVAPDISQYWQEVLKDRISEIHYVDSRSKCVVGGLESGKGFFLFHSGREVGYFPFDINGFISDLSVIKDGDDAHVLLVVQRNNVWGIERLHMPEFMQSTNAFEQTNWNRNLATQENLLKSPFFDSWKVLKNEHVELWDYNAEAKIIHPNYSNNNPVDLSDYVGKTIRCYYGDGIRDYTEATIQRVFTAQHREEREIEVTETVYYYGWQNTTNITVSPLPGVSPAWSGVFTRNSTSDLDIGYKYAWGQGAYTGYTASVNPNITDSLYWRTGRGFRAWATITEVAQTGVWTKSTTPQVGDPVYNDNFEQIGTITSASGDVLVYNNTTFTYNAAITQYRIETHTETIEVIVRAGEYAVECDLDERVIFNKLQLPIETISTTEPAIQVQDNGVYRGTFVSENGVVTLTEPMFNIQYGVPYRKIGVIEDNRSYLRQKGWGAIAFNIIDTMALKVGIKLDRLTNMVKWDGNQFFDSNLIMKNGTLICNIADIPQYEKQLIFMTDEGLPFTVLAIETAGEISDKGAN